MPDSSQLGARFEDASLQLFNAILPRLGFDVVSKEPRRSGSQKGFDIFFETRPSGTQNIRVNFFVECKAAKSVNLLPLDEFEAKPELLNDSLYNPDYWILFSPLRYLGNDFQELIQKWKSKYPFAFLAWVRETNDKRQADLYLDLFKHFPEIYSLFKQDIPKNIRNTAPENSLDEILAQLKISLNNAFDEFQERVVHRGVLPGVRRITPQAIFKARETDSGKLAQIRTGYYLLNSSSRFVWRVVCNDLDVRNERLSGEIQNAVSRLERPTTNVWVLGAPGCGKTTQMYRSAIDYALAGCPVVLINAFDLDESTDVTCIAQDEVI